MKTMGLIVVMGLGLALLALAAGGCAGQSGTQQLADSYAKYIGQERTAPLVTLTNVDEIVIRGKGMTIALNTPLTPLSVLSQNDSTWENVRQILGYGAMAYFGQGLVHDLARRPTTVDPVIVRPEVVEVAK